MGIKVIIIIIFPECALKRLKWEEKKEITGAEKRSKANNGDNHIDMYTGCQ